MVLVYFRGPALDGAVSIISGPFIAGDVSDGCPVCHFGDKRLIRVLPWLALGCVLDVVGVAIAPGYPLRLHIMILPGLIRLLKEVKSPGYCVLPQCVLPYGTLYTLDTHFLLVTHRNIVGPRGHWFQTVNSRQSGVNMVPKLPNGCCGLTLDGAGWSNAQCLRLGCVVCLVLPDSFRLA